MHDSADEIGRRLGRHRTITPCRYGLHDMIRDILVSIGDTNRAIRDTKIASAT